MKQHLLGWVTLGFAAVLAASVNDDAWDRSVAAATNLANQGRLADARRTLEQAREQAEQFGPDDRRLALVLNNLGAIYIRLNEIDEAERCYRRSAAIWEARGDAVNHLAPVTNLAGVYLARGQYSTAETLLHRALDLTQAKLGPEHPQTAAILTHLAESSCSRRDYDEAIRLAERALAIVRKIHSPTSPDLAIALDNLGTIYRAQGSMEESERLYTEAITVLENSGTPRHPAWIRALTSYAAVSVDHGDYQQARPLLERALTQAETTLGPEHPSLARILRDYALVLRKTGHKADARKMDVRASRIVKQSERNNSIGYTVDWRNLSGFR